MSLLAAAQRAWRRAPLPLRRLAAPALGWATQSYARRTLPRPTENLEDLPIKVVGLFSASSGIGASARLAARAFEALGVPVERVDASAEGLDFSRRLPRQSGPAIWIFHLNPPELLAALASLGPRNVGGARYGFWAWELPQAPSQWLKDAALVDEVWAPSRYTAQALSGAAAPVRVVPHPLFATDYDGVAPAPRRTPFQAVALFDFNSSLARKNPSGAIQAFAAAFGADGDCELTIKTQNGQTFPDQLSALRAEAPANVRIVDEVWPYAEVKRLIASADVLISLHRAEGFGLAPAEAMAMGVPVLATGYSGNLDFMDDACALLVPSQTVAVTDPQGIYGGQTWADPDLAAAAEGLKRLRADPELRRRLGAAGRARVSRQLSPEAWFETLPASVQAAARKARGS